MSFRDFEIKNIQCSNITAEPPQKYCLYKVRRSKFEDEAKDSGDVYVV